MNKKLLFAAMSLAALTACSTDELENQQNVAEGTSPIQFEVINNDATTRASMTGKNGNTISWSASDGDLFTLYHGGSISSNALNGYQNATYKAVAEEGKAATLTTPSMILKGSAIMTWPVDTTFRATGSGLTIVIPTEQTNIENNIPYVSDIVDIKARTSGTIGADNTAGYNRKYPVFMRPMASQLNLKAEYAKKDKIQELVDDAEDPIQDITINSLQLLTDESGSTKFTKEIALKFREAISDDHTRWNAEVANNAWSHVTEFDIDNISPTGQTSTLTTTCPIDKKDLKNGCKFLILPQGTISDGVKKAAVVVNTRYGKVLIAKKSDYPASKYSDDEYNAAWYRYVSDSKRVTTANNEENESATTAEKSGDNAGKYKTVAKSLALGMQQTINDFSSHKAGSGAVEGEPTGYALTRYVNVDLSKLDMSELHIKDDQQLRDAARVWGNLGLQTVTVILDGDKDTKEFEIKQKTIKLINDINAAASAETPSRSFSVKPCKETGEKCETIVITGGGEIAADLTFIKNNNGSKAAVVLKAGENWKWAASTTAVKKITVDEATGISKIINKGNFSNGETATLAIYNNATTPAQIFTVPFENAEGAKWEITAGVINVQFNVTNNGTVSIATGAQYRQDGQSVVAKKTTFENNATTLPQRFLAANKVESIGKVYNSGVFATVGDGVINNYGLIEHGIVAPGATPNENAKTYITSNQVGGNFASQFDASTNKIGTVNLPWSLRAKVDNVSISAALSDGFVSVTVTKDVKALTYSAVGSKVNTVVVNGGVETIGAISGIKYLEINQPNTEIAITEDLKYNSDASKDNSLSGLVILSDVKVNQGKTVAVKQATYLGSDLYVGGKFQHVSGTTASDAAATDANWIGYYGDTKANFASKYITY